MVFRKFYWRIVLRVVILTIALILFSYCMMNALYLRSVYLAVFAILLITELVYYVYRFTKNIELFLVNIQQRDFAIHFQEDDSTFGNLYRQLNNVTSAFKKISTEKEIQHRFLQTLVQHISVGIISFDTRGNVQLVNDSFLKLIGKIRVSSLEHLSTLNASLAKEIQRLKPEETSVVKIEVRNRLENIALNCKEFKLDEHEYKLISLQNITNELNAQELDAWQKLIRVLTHEIMNSIAPIVSLSDTLFKLVQQTKQEEKFQDTLRTGLEAIKIRSEGLQMFADAYRKLTRIPSPEFKKVNAVDLISSIQELLNPELSKRGIKIEVDVENVYMLVDQKLMEQVLINLVWNSMEAVIDVNNGLIKISTHQQESRVILSVSDNGSGIDESIRDKIFVPFFTTKKNGSGIGLALVRQIVQLHKGLLQIDSTPGAGTTIAIIL